MKSNTKIWKLIAFVGIMLFFSDIAYAKNRMQDTIPGYRPDTAFFGKRFIHRIGVEYRPGYIFPTSSFLSGDNSQWKPYKWGYAGHLKYSFQFKPGTLTDRIYGGAYQGIGVGYYDFGSKEELGNPIAVYLYQGARIARITSRLSLNYEWNFGLSFGWTPYSDTNPYNTIIGSEANAYINAGLQLNWMLCKEIDLIAGVSATHFSNGNTKFPNAGLNTMGLKVGVVYNINRPKEALTKPMYYTPIPVFQRHVSYDLTLFGSWRRKGVEVNGGQIASPDSYTVLGFNFAPMYNINYKFRAGVSLDGVYDASSNVYTLPEYGSSECFKPSFGKQIALGISGRAEYVMPYFTVGVGIGANVLHGGGDHKGIYQVLTLKVELTRSSYLHIGYNLKDFSDPNYLMLGIGFRFNNKYPTFHRR